MPNQLSFLTVVIPSFERQKFLERQISFWRNFEAKIIILDGSKAPLNLLPNKIPSNIRYLHVPDNFYKRIKLAAELISTPYAIYLPDDEFLIPSCLEKCVQFLIENPAYCSCAGRSISFGVDVATNRVDARPIYQDLRNLDICLDNPIERVMALAFPYKYQPVHSVTRKEIWSSVAEVLGMLKYLPSDMFELLFGFTAAHIGKMKVIPDLMNMRSLENAAVNSKEWDRKLMFPQWIGSSKFTGDCADFYLALTVFDIGKKCGPPVYSTTVVIGLLEYLRNRANSSFSLLSLVKNIFKKLLSDSLYKSVSQFYRKVDVFMKFSDEEKKRKSLLLSCSDLMKYEDVNVDIDTIEFIERIVRSFHGLDSIKSIAN
jgi:glycosyltransferase domain-containing protein